MNMCINIPRKYQNFVQKFNDIPNFMEESIQAFYMYGVRATPIIGQPKNNASN